MVWCGVVLCGVAMSQLNNIKRFNFILFYTIKLKPKMGMYMYVYTNSKSIIN
jgi:hypothetical protein